LAGNIELDVFGFVALNGSFAFKKATGSFVVTDADSGAASALTAVPYLTIGADITTATVSAGGVGLELNGIELAMVMVSDIGVDALPNTADDIGYTAIKASVTSADIVGISGLTVTVTSFALEINNTTDLVNTNKVLDFADTAARRRRRRALAGRRQHRARRLRLRRPKRQLRL
jgi:hypothetical protein